MCTGELTVEADDTWGLDDTWGRMVAPGGNGVMPLQMYCCDRPRGFERARPLKDCRPR
jgi:hypothetical protein